MVQKGRANQEGNCLFVLKKNYKHAASFWFYIELGKKLISIATMLMNLIEAGNPFNIPEFLSLRWLQGNLGNPEIPGCKKESN